MRMNSLLLLVLLFWSLACGWSRASAHDAGLSSSTWQLRRGILQGTITLAPADAALLVEPTTVPVSVHLDGQSVQPASALLSRSDPENTVWHLRYEAGTGHGLLSLNFDAAPQLSWGHLHHARVLSARGEVTDEYLLSERQPTARSSVASPVRAREQQSTPVDDRMLQGEPRSRRTGPSAAAPETVAGGARHEAREEPLIAGRPGGRVVSLLVIVGAVALLLFRALLFLGRRWAPWRARY